MKRIIVMLLLLLVLVGCSTQGPRWEYVLGPHGETCLVYYESAGYPNGIECDSVNPQQP